MKKKIRLAARGSALSIIQAEIVKQKMEALGFEADLMLVTTRGDRDRVSPVTNIGGDGLFVREIERVLLDGEADIAVHSAKDLPYALRDGLVIGGVPDAGSPRDCILFSEQTMIDPDAEFLIGTGSPRRILQCKAMYPNAVFSSIRGNVDTRIRKLREGQVDAILLAKAGIERLHPDLSGLRLMDLDPDDFVPAPCQGLIACECRSDDTGVRTLLEGITDRSVRARFQTERYLFKLLHAACSDPVGIYAPVSGDKISIRAMYRGKKLSAEGWLADYKELCGSICRTLAEN